MTNLILFKAGHDSTTHALQFAMYELSKNSSYQEKLRLDLSKGGAEYQDAVILETLRLYPIGAVKNFNV